MLRKVWKIRSVLFLVGLLAAFAACIKERDPEQDMKDVRALTDQIVLTINQGNLGELNKFYVQPVPEGKGPNALLAAATTVGDAGLILHKRRITVDRDEATLRFTLSSDPVDSSYSYIHFRKDGDWKIADFEFE
jgi:ABC-type transporter MlaC component